MQMPFDSSRPRSAVRYVFPAMSTVAFALILAGCGGDAATEAGNSAGGGKGASANTSVRFDSSLRDAPCSVVTADTLAGVFGLPVDEIEQHASMGMCLYEWKGDGQVMDATVHVTRVSDSAAHAAEYFANATGGMTGAELDEAMDSIREQARESAGEEGTAADAVLGATGDAPRGGSGGLQFRDVAGIGDQARMRVDKGDLNVLYGNLHFSVTAYHGAQMEVTTTNMKELVAASQAWQKETLPQREEQTLEVARAAIATL